MAVNDTYVLKMKQSMFTQSILNVFYYTQVVATADPKTPSELLFDAFDASVLSVWKTAFITSISIEEVEVINIATPADTFAATPTNNTGSRAIGDNLRAPTWIAAGFKSNRAGAGTRAAFKRFAGLGEVDIDDNSISPAFVTLAAGLQAAMADLLGTVGVNMFQPVQVQSGWLLGFAPVVNFNITSWNDPKLTSQVSRKP